MRPWAKFPSFETMFGRSDVGLPGHYVLLDARDGTSGAVANIRRCVERSGPNLTSELKEMLAQPDWRPQVVAAATLLVGATDEQLDLLWGAIRRPSWVSPQLAASAAHLDAQFAERARLLIERRCVFDEVPYLDFPPERHSYLGPLSYQLHQAKTLSVLVALCSLQGEPHWLKSLTSAEDIRAMLSSDVDGGARIAVEWIARMTPLIENASGVV